MATKKRKGKTKAPSTQAGSEEKRPMDEDAPDSGVGDSIRLGKEGDSLMKAAGGIGVVLLGVSVALGAAAGDGWQQFFHSYLTAFMWTLSIALGALWWVTLQHLVNAKWSTVVRRVGELYAQAMPLMVLLALPIVVPIFLGNAALYDWVDPHKVHTDHLLHHKAPYLNVPFFAIRCLIYFGCWALLARFFFKSSLEQDKSGKPNLVDRMRSVSAPGMIAIALTLTFAAFDFLMSLEADWFSTIFGVYYFAGCVIGLHCVLALSLMWLQSKGRLVKSVTTEHYHDLGKMMFAFVIFWAYIAFSQFLLIWYANIPEETHWYKSRFFDSWGGVSTFLLVGHFIVPFFFLLSRHVKRRKTSLAIGSVWLLFMHFVDLHWLVQPALHETFSPQLVDLTTWFGMGALLVAAALFNAKNRNLVPVNDPRLEKSLAFENI